MRKEGILLFTAFVLVLCMAGVMAETQINIKTLSNHKVQVQVLDPAQVFYVLDSYKAVADAKGDASVIYKGDAPSIKVKVMIWEEGQAVEQVENFGPFNSGKALLLKVIPGEASGDYMVVETPVQNITNSTNVINETAVANQTSVSGTDTKKEESNSSGILSGFTLSEETKATALEVGKWIIIGIVALVVLFFLIKFVRRWMRNRPAENYKVVKLSDLNKQIDDAEKKIKDAQNEINKIKNRDKIYQMERKLEQDRAELERMKRGN